MLESRNLSVFYGRHRAVENVSVKVSPGEIVVMLGANGAGKSTFLRAIAGQTKAAQGGAVLMDGTEITHWPPHEIVETGIALVPEDRGVFADLTVQDNLLLGAHPKRARAREAENMERVLSLFPKLAERRRQLVRTMSGGERQMVAVGRAMMSAPSILMLDEPSLGLAPLIAARIFEIIVALNGQGVAVLLVEQNARAALKLAKRGYVIELGRTVLEGENLSENKRVLEAYLGDFIAAR
jgi:branched-chain amino acid transport system ATP-binding protein